MKKHRRRKKKIHKTDKRQRLKTAAAVFLVIMVVLLGISMCDRTDDGRSSEELRGVWVSYIDYGNLGLTDQTEEGFRANAERFYDRAEEMHINTVFFHVRAFRDAAYKSDHFPMSRNIWTGAEEIPYDPLEIMIELAHEHDIQLHAWLNPYRNHSFGQEILDPADEASTEEIVLCVEEILENYEVDGVHFDDYFYAEDDTLNAYAKKENVNRMIREVYEAVHNAEGDVLFGISPAGNTGYCESLGADIKTWLSEEGYVDYIAPQIYWTDEHTAAWRDKMFSDTLAEWESLNKINVPLYPGLALYKAGTGEPDDPGWQNRDDNIAFQVKAIRESGCGGFILYSASDIFRSGAESELMEYQNLVF